jgi:hypothetical protein
MAIDDPIFNISGVNLMPSASKHRLMRVLLLIVPLTLACGPIDLARDILGRLETVTPTPEPRSEEHFVYFVSPDGSDGNSCLDWDVACETIAGAIAKSSSGDGIQVAAGTYMEEAGLQVAVGIPHNLTITGDGADTTIIDAGGTRTGVYISGEANVRITGVTIQNGGGTSPGNGIAVRGGSHLTLIDSIVRDSTDCGIEVVLDTFLTLENVDILNNSGPGICSAGTVDITGGSINNNGGSGVVSVVDLTVDGTEAADNVISGFYINGGTADLANVTILRNGLGRTHENGLFIRDADVTIRDSRLTDNEYGVHVFGPGASLILDNVTIEGSHGIGLEIEDATANLTHALVRDNGTLFANTSIAGGIDIQNSTVEISDSQVSRNHNGGISSTSGGHLIAQAIYVSHNTGSMAGLNNGTGSTAEISDSAFIGNGGDPDSAGIENRGTMSVINTTVSGNNPYGIAASDGQLSLSFATLAENDGFGLAMFRGAETVRTIENVIIANNLERDCSLSSAPGTISPTYGGYNVDTDGSCGFGNTVDPADLHLGALETTGGAGSSYYPLEIGSPAIDAGTGSCPSADQSGVVRPFGSACDAGAIEFDPTRSASTMSLEGSEVPEIAPQGEVEVIDDGLCWTGPASNYDVVGSLAAGQRVELVATSLAQGWVVILHPEFTSFECWTPEDNLDIEPSFDLSGLPVFTIPPTPTLLATPTSTPTPIPQPPAAPSSLQIANRVCSGSDYSVTLSWKDNANNETGFHIYRNGGLVGTVGSNATQFTDNPPYGGPYTYVVKAYNGAGESSGPNVNEAGCIY